MARSSPIKWINKEKFKDYCPLECVSVFYSLDEVPYVNNKSNSTESKFDLLSY